MTNPNKVFGQAKLKIDGQVVATSRETSMEIGGTTREAVEGDNEAGAFTEKTVPAKIEFSGLYKGGVSLADIRAIDNATVTLDTDIGTQWIVVGAYCADVVSFSQDGKFKAVFQGPPAEEVL